MSDCIVLMLALVFGLIIGSYLDPLLIQRGLSEWADRGSAHA